MEEKIKQRGQLKEKKSVNAMGKHCEFIVRDVPWGRRRTITKNNKNKCHGIKILSSNRPKLNIKNWEKKICIIFGTWENVRSFYFNYFWLF